MDNDIIIQKITEIATKQEGYGEDIKILYKKTNEINSLNIAIASLNSSVNGLNLAVTKLNNKVDSIAEQPLKEKAKNWDSVVNKIIGGSIAILLGYISFKLGIN